jgi:hypothetical protein
MKTTAETMSMVMAAKAARRPMNFNIVILQEVSPNTTALRKKVLPAQSFESAGSTCLNYFLHVLLDKDLD